jgi:hypothetical protein
LNEFQEISEGLDIPDILPHEVHFDENALKPFQEQPLPPPNLPSAVAGPTSKTNRPRRKESELEAAKREERDLRRLFHKVASKHNLNVASSEF